MRVEHVRAFVVLAEELNFRRAAARLFVSQPALTAQLHQLERELGVILFDRGPGGTRLTEAGRDLLPDARDVLRATDGLLGGAAPWRVRGPEVRVAPRAVRVGIGPGGIGSATWLAFQLLIERRPDLDPRGVPLTFSSALPALDRGEVEAVLLHGPVDDEGRRQVWTVGHVAVAVIVPALHWMAARPTITVDDVAPLARAVPPPEMSEAFARFWMLSEHPLARPTAGLRLTSEETQAMAKEASRAGLVGLWPSDVAVPSNAGVVIRRLATERLAPLQVVTRPAWRGTDDLVAAAMASVEETAAIGGLVPLSSRVAPDQQS